ncbi:rRNA processing/ribosome biogenesis-domain-containing protein [Rhodocollybia butyracea]|uniref:Pre-rRNA-processing protein RIX1 n=1 Tax=Rhodocollybia butyracea TaxID=206335 RepID=A0A9P5QAL8_9AGAR|nr:rRNA processing/ribosome biogenesis-domain-containing protein [Rhodocollybia butyracea]
MESPHSLKALLNFHLASDASAVIHLPFILDSITSKHFQPSNHLTKWTSRVNSLLHSKDAGARWAGLCLAHRTSICSKSVMIECAQSWLGIAIPLLSKKEPLPTLKASIYLCRLIFSNATDIPEFQRQISTPNVPKFTTALVHSLEKDVDLELKKVALKTLTRLVPLYPNIHRASHPALSTIVSRIFVHGSAGQELVRLASELGSVLHFTGGKVGAANLWRKSLDESMVSAWTAFVGVRTTVPDENGRLPQMQLLHEEPITSVTLSIERLYTSIQVLCDLLQSPTQRPVQVPVGSLVNLASKMILVTVDDEPPANVDPIVWATETSVIPGIWKMACKLITRLTKCLGRHMSPYSSRLLSYIVFHLEQNLPSSQQIPFLKAVHALLAYCHPTHLPSLSSRLIKTLLSGLTLILPNQTDIQNSITQANGSGKGKKGKKKARTYEGDELFRASSDVVCPAVDDAKALLAACDVLQLLLRNNTDVSPALQSMASRVILALFLGLPQIIPTTLSPYPQVYGLLLSKIHEIALELGSGSTSAMSKSLNLVLGAASNMDIDQVNYPTLIGFFSLIYTEIGLVAQSGYPHSPSTSPLLRPLPKVEYLTLFRTEESTEEAEARQSLRLDSVSNTTVPDVVTGEAPLVPESSLSSAPSYSKPSIPLTQITTATRSHEQIKDSASTLSSSVSASLVPVVPHGSSQERHADPGVVPLLFASTSSAPAAPTKPASFASYPSQSTTTTELATAPLDDADEEMPSINLDSDSDSD